MWQEGKRWMKDQDSFAEMKILFCLVVGLIFTPLVAVRTKIKWILCVFSFDILSSVVRKWNVYTWVTVNIKLVYICNSVVLYIFCHRIYYLLANGVFGWAVGEVRIDFGMPKSILTIFYDVWFSTLRINFGLKNWNFFILCQNYF